MVNGSGNLKTTKSVIKNSLKMRGKYWDIHDRPRGISISGQNFVTLLIKPRKDVTCRQSGSDDCEERPISKMHSRAETSAETEYGVCGFLHFRIELIESIRIELHGISIYLWVVEHVPGGLVSKDLYSLLKTHQMLGRTDVPFGRSYPS